MTRPGSRAEITAIAYAPSNSATASCTARSEVAVRRAVPMRVHEMRDRLAVGLRLERIPCRSKAVAQRLEVLDDAVVHDRDLVVRDVRMRVDRRRRAVRRPPRVRDAGGADDLALASPARRGRRRARCDTSRVSAVPGGAVRARRARSSRSRDTRADGCLRSGSGLHCAAKPRRRCRTCRLPFRF